MIDELLWFWAGLHCRECGIKLVNCKRKKRKRKYFLVCYHIERVGNKCEVLWIPLMNMMNTQIHLLIKNTEKQECFVQYLNFLYIKMFFKQGWSIWHQFKTYRVKHLLEWVYVWCWKTDLFIWISQTHKIVHSHEIISSESFSKCCRT